MSSSRFFTAFLFLSVICFASISSLTLPANFQARIEKDEIECTKKILKSLSGEDSTQLGDFHSKSDVEKIKALWEETRSVLRNGNDITKHFEQGLTDSIKTYGGEDNVDKWVQEYIANSTNVIPTDDDKLTSCMVASLFEFAYKKTKDSFRDGRFGESQTLLPMVKDMLTTFNPEKESLNDSPVAIMALFPLIIGAIPDFVLSVFTVMSYVPENILKQFAEDFPKAISTFDPMSYMEGLENIQ